MSHSYSHNYVHAVFSTKGRTNQIPLEIEKQLYPFVVSVARQHGIPVVSAGGMPNHSHLLFMLPTTTTLASAINTFKTNSSRFLHEQRLPFHWQEGYGAFSVSPSQLEKVSVYIRTQQEHHKKISFEEEFLALLQKSKIPYDPKHAFG
jgi:REP-associated tyrosine transposase